MNPTHALTPLYDLRTFGRYAFGLKRFLGDQLASEDCRQTVERQRSLRSQTFLTILDRAVFAQSWSPYRKLLVHAGIELGDIRRLVDESGVEGALQTLWAKGVYLSLAEFKGSATIERPGLSIPAQAWQFDNPLVDPAYTIHSGASGGRPRRMLIDFGHLEYEACLHSLFLDTFGLRDHPFSLWRPVPPASSGILNALTKLKVGGRVERWFSQTRALPSARFYKEFLFTQYTLRAASRSGAPLPAPIHVPMDDAEVVAEWARTMVEHGAPPLINTSVGSALRVCGAAAGSGRDIGGTFFRVGGEPLTPSRARALEASGARVAGNYAMSETGTIGLACAAPSEVDDLHVAGDKVAVIAQLPANSSFDGPVSPLMVTTLHPRSPKLMLNVESGDAGVLESRACGCPLDGTGRRLHLSRIRSYEKMTAEGMNFLSFDLLRLVDEVLPTRFGGDPGDYQLVEQEEHGLARVRVIVSPRVQGVDEEDVVRTVLSALGSGKRYETMMSGVWRDAEVVKVERRDPYVTGAGKILPIHTLR